MDIFMKKDPPVLTMDEMRSSVKIIDDINERSVKAVEDLRDINQEEVNNNHMKLIFYNNIVELINEYSINPKTTLFFCTHRCTWIGIPRRIPYFKKSNNLSISIPVYGILLLTSTNDMSGGITDH